MAKRTFHAELEQKATRAVLAQAIYRWESAVIIALTVGLAVLTVAGVIPTLLPFWRWWFWLILGVIGEVALVWSSLRDPQFRSQAVADMFQETFNVQQIRDKKRRAQVEQALKYRERIGQVIHGTGESVLHSHMADVSQDIGTWMENVFRLAKRLDDYEADDTIHKDMQTVEPAIEGLKKRLAVEDDDNVKRQISQAIAQRQIQRENLHQLKNVMERAEIQLESTITAMGTVYSQMMILSSRDVSSGRAQRLQQDIAGQVQALQDIVQTMDEVYQAGAGPLGPGP